MSVVIVKILLYNSERKINHPKCNIENTINIKFPCNFKIQNLMDPHCNSNNYVFFMGGCYLYNQKLFTVLAYESNYKV